MENHNLLQELSRIYGVSDSYRDAFGNHVTASEETKSLILTAMGLNLESREALEFELSSAKKIQIPGLVVIKDSKLSVQLPLANGNLSWRLQRDSELLEEGRAEVVNFKFELNLELPIGYYELILLELEAHILLVSAPATAYLPEVLEQKKLWGLTTQLYSLRKNETDSFGDFSALRELKKVAKSFGASFLGLNPLLATGFPSDVGVSPYSPISRHALNELYLETNPVASKSELIDYQLLANFKNQILLTNYQESSDFLSFKKSAPLNLLNYALYAELRQQFGDDWQQWPANYKIPNSREVLEFKTKNQSKIDYYLYLQFLADKQLRSCSSKDFKSDCVLYLDFPVGVRLSSSDVWSDQKLFALKASAGAPPDELAPQGQSWGLPPFNPKVLLQQGCRPFIEALRFSMQYAGAIRIDHVMSLWRLYWSVENGDGAYVAYPAEELTSIVKLESHLQKCVVIGEDLGTVPEETKHFMSSSKVLSYKVFYFEKDSGQFKSPESYPRESLCCIGTHDLAPLKGYLAQEDLRERERLNLHSRDVNSRLSSQRNDDLNALIAFLGLESIQYSEVLEKLYLRLAEGSSMLLAVQLEDLFEQFLQVNLPGTVSERPNWKLHLPKLIQDLEQKKQLLEDLSKARTKT